MQNITDFLYENLNEVDEARLKELEDKLNEAEKNDKDAETITDEKTFRDYAENKFKEVFGDELDEKKMKDTIDGLLDDNKDLVEAGEWGELVGMLNKSFAE